MSHTAELHERAYTVVLRPEPEGGYTVLVPALPGVVTYGATEEEALAMAQDAIALHIAGLEADGLTVPEEPLPVTTRRVRVAL